MTSLTCNKCTRKAREKGKLGVLGVLRLGKNQVCFLVTRLEQFTKNLAQLRCTTDPWIERCVFTRRETTIFKIVVLYGGQTDACRGVAKRGTCTASAYCARQPGRQASATGNIDPPDHAVKQERPLLEADLLERRQPGALGNPYGLNDVSRSKMQVNVRMQKERAMSPVSFRELKRRT